ncbi:MAG: VirB4-like conjugal transfer ATPase, CD1110 family, partial [Anaerovoracaceae bacterium]
MLKSIRTTMKLDREKVRIPHRVQDAIPVKAVYEDGIFQLAKNKYSKSWKFTDINYDVFSDEERIETIKSYGALLNSFESSATTKITIHNRRISQKDFGERILLEEKDDSMNRYRREYNEMLQAKAAGNNAILQEKYITVSVHKNSLEEARGFFRRAGTELTTRLGKLGSRCQELDGLERLQILHSFYRVGEEDHFHFDLKDCRRKGHSFKDYICPDSMEFASDHFRMGQRFGRCLFIKDVAAYLKDTLVAELSSLNQNMMLSIDILPVPMAEAIREAENRLLGVSTNITTWQRKQNANNNFGAIVPYDMEQQLADSKEFLDDLTIRDQQMMLALITIVHTADSKKQLDADTESLKSIIQTRHCQMGILRFQQLDGLNTVLPAGQRKIDALRTFTTESLSAFMPFHV